MKIRIPLLMAGGFLVLALAKPAQLRSWWDTLRGKGTPRAAVAAPRLVCDISCVVTQGQSFEFPVSVEPTNSAVFVGGLPSAWRFEGQPLRIAGVATAIGRFSLLLTATNTAGAATRTVLFVVQRAHSPGTTRPMPVPFAAPTGSMPSPMPVSLAPGPAPATAIGQPATSTTPSSTPTGGSGATTTTTSTPNARPNVVSAGATVTGSPKPGGAKPLIQVGVTPENAFGRPTDLARRLHADFLALAHGELQRSGRFEVMAADAARARGQSVTPDYILQLDIVKYLLTVRPRVGFTVFTGQSKYTPTVAYLCNWKLLRQGLVQASGRVEGNEVGREFTITSEVWGKRRPQAPTVEQATRWAVERGEWPASESHQTIIRGVMAQLFAVNLTALP
jgi:hypothetical protein